MNYKSILSPFGILLLSVGFISCAKERPVKQVLPEIHRIDKSFFTDDSYFYNVTVMAASPNAPTSFTGDQSFGTSLITWQMTEKTLMAYLVDPRYTSDKALKEPIISFPIEKHVDVELAKNADEEETHIQIENDKERPWKERKFARVNFSDAKIIPSDVLLLKLYETYGCIKEVNSDLTNLDQQKDSLNLNLVKTYRVAQESEKCYIPNDYNVSDTFSIELKLSFLKKKNNLNFKPVSYSKGQQNKVGIFKTTVKQFDSSNHPTEDDYATHWDPAKKIVYVLSKNFPKQYKKLAQEVIDQWNKILKDTIGTPLIELRENQGEEVGDLRTNFIAWIEEPIYTRLLGYGPFHWDPFTGEIINGSVFIYAGNFKQLVYDFLEMDDLEKKTEQETQILKRKNNNIKGDMSKNKDNVFLITQKDFSASPHHFYFNEAHLKKEIEEIPTPEKLSMGKKDSKTLENALVQFYHHSQRCYYPGSELNMHVSFSESPKSFEEVFQKMITSTLAHEIGHTLGLRHNFMGSVDKAHFTKNGKTSSVMDYLPLENIIDKTPGLYDKAALKFGFTGEFDFTEAYLYCSDEEEEIDPFCNHFDEGTSAEEIATYLKNHYHTYYKKRNHRGKRLHFKDTGYEELRYAQFLWERYFLPIREFVDYALRISRKGVTLKQEALPPEKILALAQDLQKASKIAFTFFKDILLDEEHDYQNTLYRDYSQKNEIQVRGTRLDKVLAIFALTNRSLTESIVSAQPIEPWGVQNGTFFDIPEFQSEIAKLFSELSIQSPYPLIIFLSVYHFLNETPRNIFESSVPMKDILKIFEVEEIPYSDENLINIKDRENKVFFVDEDRAARVIISAHKESYLLSIMPGNVTPPARLILGYNSKKEESSTIKNLLMTTLTERNPFRSKALKDLDDIENILFSIKERLRLFQLIYEVRGFRLE